MKTIVKLIFILSLFTQVCHAQKIETEDDYKVLYDSIVARLRIAQKDTSCYIDKPFSEFVKHLDKCGIKIIQVGMGRTSYEPHEVFPRYLHGVILYFTTAEQQNFASNHRLSRPMISIYFNESLPYEKALSLDQKYKGYFMKDVEEFYSDAVIKSIEFGFMDDMYRLKRLLEKQKALYEKMKAEE